MRPNPFMTRLPLRQSIVSRTISHHFFSKPQHRSLSSATSVAMVTAVLLTGITAIDFFSKDKALPAKKVLHHSSTPSPKISTSSLSKFQTSMSRIFGKSRKRFENTAFSLAALATILVVSLSMVNSSNPLIQLPCPGKSNHDAIAMDGKWMSESPHSNHNAELSSSSNVNPDYSVASDSSPLKSTLVSETEPSWINQLKQRLWKWN